MDELIARITASVGLEPGQAKNAVGAILGFLEKEAPDADVEKMLAAIPGAKEAIAEAGSGGMFASMMPGVMGLGSQLMGMGLGMGEINGVAKETIAYAKEKAGEGPVDEVIASIPGLSQFI